MVKLTSLTKAAGWAAKVGPEDLYNLLSRIPIKKDDNTILSFDTSDDAGVYKLNNIYIVQTIDLITPIVDDPYTFGRIVAINSMSDIFAMGGVPKTALSILLYNCQLDKEIIQRIIEGAVCELNKENCILLGGHTLEDEELKFGFAITGINEDKKLYRNNTINLDDDIILTKPIGTGVISTAIKADLACSESINDATESMLTSNSKASKIMKKYNISACTDVTGFSLTGHLYEMTKSSDYSITINTKKIPIMEKALEYSSMGLIPAGAYRIKAFLSAFTDYRNIKDPLLMLLFDPQTSGGLIITLQSNQSQLLLEELLNAGYSASIIGKVTKKKEKLIYYT